MPKKRIQSVDTLRGTAMALVIYAHARIVLDPAAVGPLLYTGLIYMSSIASIAFMVISGAMISYFLFSGKDFKKVRTRYAKRALLLLLGCHITIRLVAYPTFADSVGLINYLFLYFPITDTIAVALLTAPFLIRKTGYKLRALIAGLLLIITPCVTEFYHPGLIALKVCKEIFFGQANQVENTVFVFYPLIPWLAIFLIGSFLGQGLAKVKAGRITISRLTQSMRRWALGLFIFSITLIIGYKLLKLAFGTTWDPRIFEALFPKRTSLLLPGYLAILLFVFSAVMTYIDDRCKYGVIAKSLAVFGRTSLFTYICQYAVAWSLPAVLGLKYGLNLPLFLIALVVILILCWLLSYAYGRYRGWLPAHFSESKISF